MPPSSKNPAHIPASTLLSQVNNGYITRRIEWFERHNQAISPEEILLRLNPAEVERQAELHFAQSAHRIERTRNWLILLPLIVTWISLGLAALAFSQSVAHDSHVSGQSFLYLWSDGFPDIKMIKLGSWPLSLIINLPPLIKNWHYMSFGDVILLDVFLLLLLVFLTLRSNHIEQEAQQKAGAIGLWVQEKVDQLCEQSLVRSLGPGAENKQPQWAVEVHTAIKELRSTLTDVNHAVSTSEQSFATTIQQFTQTYEKQNRSVEQLLDTVKGVEASVSQLHTIYQQGKETYESLNTILPRLDVQFSRMAESQVQAHQATQAMATQFGQAVDAINELARPFAAANLAQIADKTAQSMQYTSDQQQAMLANIDQINKRLDRFNTSAGSRRWTVSQLWPFRK